MPIWHTLGYFVGGSGSILEGMEPERITLADGSTVWGFHLIVSGSTLDGRSVESLIAAVVGRRGGVASWTKRQLMWAMTSDEDRRRWGAKMAAARRLKRMERASEAKPSWDPADDEDLARRAKEAGIEL